VNYAVGRLPLEGVFIDGGAHVGLISFQIAAKRPDVRIHAFEPHPVVAKRFRENLDQYQARVDPSPGSRITFNKVGLSNTTGRIPFDFDTFSSHQGSGSGSIPVTTLDEHLYTNGIHWVDVLKLDIEGHELQALEGAREALNAHRIRAIVLETMDAHGPLGPVHELLVGAGYRTVAMPDPRPALIRRLRPLQRAENTAYESMGDDDHP
jgi:FkbM family methyltransferase